MICLCGKVMTYHDENGDAPIETDIEEQPGSFYFCSCGKVIVPIEPLADKENL